MSDTSLVGEGAVLQLGDDLLDDGVVAVRGLRVEHRLLRVGEHRVVTPGGEQGALPGPDHGGVQSFDAAHDQAGTDVFVEAPGGERGEADPRSTTPKIPQQSWINEPQPELQST
ncbi:MAG: hypothetical protein HHJ14_13515 [Cellulomonas sp.]|nr:hypothetical protein [Cellulomonas sp.]